MRRLPVLAVLAALVAVAGAAHAQFGESITVARILLDVRVTGPAGDAITGLQPADFEVKIGGYRAEVLSATWVDDELAIQDAIGEEGRPEARTTREGRLFIYFIQTDFAKETARIRGQMHFLQYADELVDTLLPGDRVAVLSFDSHLKLRADFTSDREQIMAAMRNALLSGEAGDLPIVPSPSLAARLDRNDMRTAGDSEAALIVIGNALRGIPGPKTMLLMGWGLGQLTSAGVKMKGRYRAARNTLEAARVTIFALDTTDADYHSLEVGLEKAAQDTGGFYAKTHVFAGAAVERLRRTLAGRYELELRRPESLARGTHDVDVRVKRRGATVLAPGSWMDR